MSGLGLTSLGMCRSIGVSRFFLFRNLESLTLGTFILQVDEGENFWKKTAVRWWENNTSSENHFWLTVCVCVLGLFGQVFRNWTVKNGEFPGFFQPSGDSSHTNFLTRILGGGPKPSQKTTMEAFLLQPGIGTAIFVFTGLATKTPHKN